MELFHRIILCMYYPIYMEKIFGHLCSLVICEAAISNKKGNTFFFILIIFEFSTSLRTRSVTRINISLNLHIQ